MGIKCSISQREFDRLIKQIVGIVGYEIFNTLAFLGEQCTTRIRDRSAEESWIDHTGNLRSSIGYAIYDHGKKIVESVFKQVLEGSEGTQEGRTYIETLATQYANTYALFVVAGMSYADYVEAIESKDVLASTEVWAKSKIDGYMRQAQKKAVDKVNKLIAA